MKISGVCKVFVTISATMECFMLLIVVGTLRVPSLQTKLLIVVDTLRVPFLQTKLLIVVDPLRVPSLQTKLLIVVGTLRVPSLQTKTLNSSRHSPSAVSSNKNS